ncbi:hypothetical protein OHA72_04615 [Dactylosporangium sp. NBC_01737]|jgi:hypothetical protein|uniref:hypothetical protein n=1 Tax=Dactylosporangium sp. NBC_01737 TaxID=2975959 RepID=UPI002E0DD4FF|nr:hypothetical protein OHA72_04615 [Dactylosporangium sp. NBC_01737]
MIDNELIAQSAADAARLESEILAAAGRAPKGADELIAVRALANALVVVVQEYLEQHSNAEDVELFFEVHGRQPDDIEAWPANILADLSRHRIPADDRSTINVRAVRTATGYIRDSSPLALG